MTFVSCAAVLLAIGIVLTLGDSRRELPVSKETATAVTSAVQAKSDASDVTATRPLSQDAQPGEHNSTTASPIGERYAMLVGVRKYSPTSGLRDLRYTDADVEELAETLRGAGFRDENVLLMTQRIGAEDTRYLPTSVNILKELRALMRSCDRNDMVVIAFAGHGVQFRGEADNYFCPVDARVEDRTTLISMTEVYKLLETSEAGFKLLLADACRNDPFSSNARRASVDLESNTRPQRLRPPGGVAAFYSCSEGETAFEDAELGHGVFFHFLIEGLRGEADIDSDLVVSLEELAAYTKKRVPDFVRSRFDAAQQVPHVVNNSRGVVTLARVVHRPSAPAEDKPSEPPAQLTGPVAEPVWLAVERLRADAERVTLAMNGPAPPAKTKGVPVPEFRETGRGFRCVILSGVAPWERQVAEIAASRRLASAAAASLLEYLDFEIERQTARDGENPWGGPWERVDPQPTLDVLRTSSDFDDDGVDLRSRDAVLTMPLPKRIDRAWSPPVMSPDVGEAPLAPQQQDLEKQLTDSILDTGRRVVSFDEASRNPLVRGFHSIQWDVRREGVRLLANPAMTDALLRDFNQRTGLILERPQLRDRMTTLPHVVFRFADFNVVSGMAYRYRVRLVLRNPSFGLSPEWLTAPAVGEGQTRPTPWSSPTAPCLVEDDVEFYLSRIGTNRFQDSNLARFNVYKWEVQSGSFLTGDFIVIVGQMIGGVRRAELLAPPVEKRYGDVEFRTNELLVDTLESRSQIDEFLHRDLALPHTARSRINAVDLVLVADQAGGLYVLDTLTRQAAELSIRSRHDAFQEKWKDKLLDPDGPASIDRLALIASGEPAGPPKPTSRLRRTVSPPDRLNAAGPAPLAPPTANPSAPVTEPVDPNAPALAMAPFDPPTARSHQEAWAKHLGVKTEETISAGIRLVLIPPGEYRRGAPAADQSARAEERPQHTVRISRPFYLGAAEITQSQWLDVMGFRPWKKNSRHVEAPNLPATYVSWKEARTFCQRLSAREGTKFRLPTDAEWEMACRSGTTTRYSYGDSPGGMVDYGWCRETTGGESFARAIALKRPNPLGLYDMHGNVSEWCETASYRTDSYERFATSIAVDPFDAVGMDRHPSARGGSWDTPAAICRSSARREMHIDRGTDETGFRIVRVIGD